VSKSLGRPFRLSQLDVARWYGQVLATATCHVWMGAVGGDGYGRIGIRDDSAGQRMLTPHQVAARLRFGVIPGGATILHDCEVRLCCRTDPGHVRIGTQSENMRDAVRRGRAVGPRPGRVDVRGMSGASRAIQSALAAAPDRSPGGLAAVLAAVLAEGDPWRDQIPLFAVPAAPATSASVRVVGLSPAPIVRPAPPTDDQTLPMFPV
jgi:hypothetical protein